MSERIVVVCPDCGQQRELKRPARGNTCKACASRRNGRLNATRPSRPTDVERLMRFVKVVESGCWVWTGSTFANGYGQFTLAGRSCIAHRAAYTFMRQQIPAGLQLDHLCRERRCVNPDHLEPVTPGENTRRARTHRRPKDTP